MKSPCARPNPLFARWIAQTREALLESTRDRLVDEYGVPRSEIDSVVRMIGSQLDVSIANGLMSR